MKKEELVNILIDFGLSQHEAMVYIASLSLGPSTVQEISKKSGVKRTTVYTVIDNLKSKGIMKTEVQGLKKFFLAEKPERLEGIIDQKKDSLKKMIPELNAIHSLKSGESFIKYYEGVGGVKTVYNSILDDLKYGDEYMILSDMSRFLNMDKKYFSNFIEKRAKLNLKIRTILQDNDDARYYKKIEKNTNQEIKILPKEVDLTANLVVLPHKIIITQIVEPIITILIENQSIVKMQQEQFEIIWKSLP